jgi:hypothetical protein
MVCITNQKRNRVMEQETKDLIANQVALELGGMIGRFMRGCIIIAGLAGLAGTIVATGEATPPARHTAQVSKPTVAHIAAKPVKHRIKSRKKCQCECKKVVDTPENSASVNSIEIAQSAIGPRE